MREKSYLRHKKRLGKKLNVQYQSNQEVEEDSLSDEDDSNIPKNKKIGAQKLSTFMRQTTVTRAPSTMSQINIDIPTGDKKR